jgi:hypothetical protein
MSNPKPKAIDLHQGAFKHSWGKIDKQPVIVFGKILEGITKGIQVIVPS